MCKVSSNLKNTNCQINVNYKMKSFTLLAQRQQLNQLFDARPKYHLPISSVSFSPCNLIANFYSSMYLSWGIYESECIVLYISIYFLNYCYSLQRSLVAQRHFIFPKHDHFGHLLISL